jgi:transposase-like protein
MREPQERSELIRAVTIRGEAVSTVAGRLGVSMSTAYRWMRVAEAGRAPMTKPTFVEVVAERAERSTILVRVGVAEIEVHPGFEARLLREVAEALAGCA